MVEVEGTSKVVLLPQLTDVESEACSQKGTGCGML